MKNLIKISLITLLIVSSITLLNSCKKKPTPPVVTTTDVTAVTRTTASSGGEVTDDGGAEVTARGVCWNTSANPTTTNSKTSDGKGTGSFTSSLTQLTPETKYYVRAYATNSEETSYGNEVSFTTGQITLAALTTSDVTSITQTSAVSGGAITDDGGGTITARGVCWSTSQNPTTADSKTDEGPGTGTFVSNLTNLDPGITYYVRAYAINSAGTAYGDEKSFTTEQIKDADGNVYTTVTIGTQVWLVENLKTTKYNDGTDIPLVTDGTEWINLTTPGYCWYNNDESANKSTYGAIYNLYTVNIGNICPDGWHVPTDDEWTILENYLISNGYNYDGTTTDNKIAKALSSDAGWALSAVEGSVGNTDYPEKRNASGLTVLPGGSRRVDGTFNYIGTGTILWTSTGPSATELWTRDWYYSNVDVKRISRSKEYGGYVRCMKD